jgi:hypothetical protein
MGGFFWTKKGKNMTVEIGNQIPREVLNEHVEAVETTALGTVQEATHIKSSLSPFLHLPTYKIHYPENVTRVLENVYEEYNEAFTPLVSANQEWESDYRFARNDRGTPINRWVQVDMVGLPKSFLQKAEDFSEDEIRNLLKGSIFEIENSIAMYQLLDKIFSNGTPSRFSRIYRASLEELKREHQRPVALLAVTDQKHEAMRTSEFGKSEGEDLSDDEVHHLSGFDRFFGPEEFKRYLDENNGECDYLLFARTSDPVAKLKKPGTYVEVPLLENDETRRVIKANTITFNVDNPTWDNGDSRRINDTKEYLPSMGMAFEARQLDSLFSDGVISHMANGKPFVEYQGNRLSADFEDYLLTQGIEPRKVGEGEVQLRAKPMKGAYGCYGHLTQALEDRKFRAELKKNIQQRGPYVIQPELATPVIVNETTGQAYTYIDRNFLTTDGNEYRFMGGFRSMMPIDYVEAKQGRIHGNGATVWAEVTIP